MPALLSILPYMKKYRLHSLLTALLMIISAVACRDVNENALVTAENLMMEHPDSALSVLESIDGSCLTGELQARHALLLSQAYDKNYIDLTSDSLISIATDYYEKHGNDRHRLMMALYYGATVYYNAEDYDRSGIDATRAYEIACLMNDSYWIAKSAERLADLFYRTYNIDEGIEFRKKAISRYAEANEIESADWALIDLAVDYSANREYEKAIAIMNRLISEKRDAYPESGFLSRCIRELFHFYVEKGEYEQAKICFDELRRIDAVSAFDLGDLGYAEVKLGNFDRAKEYIDSAYLLVDSNDVHEILTVNIAQWEYLKNIGDKRDIVAFTEKLIDTQNHIALRTVNQSVLGAQRDFYNVQSQSAKQKISRVYGYIFIGIVIIALIVTLIVIYAKLRMRLKDKELELKINEIALLTAKISETSNRVDTGPDSDELHVIVDRLLARWFAPLNSLLDEYYETGDSVSAKSTMFSRVEEELKKITSEKSIKDIVDMVDDSLGGALSRLRNDYTEINDKDITFLALNIAGLSPRAICLFLDIKIKTVYSRRKRLKDKIAVLDTPDKDTLLKYLA